MVGFQCVMLQLEFFYHTFEVRSLFLVLLRFEPISRDLHVSKNINTVRFEQARAGILAGKSQKLLLFLKFCFLIQVLLNLKVSLALSQQFE